MEDYPQPQLPSLAEHPIRSAQNVQYLNDDEINEFLDTIDSNRDGYIDETELEEKLNQAHDELLSQPSARRANDTFDRHAFLRSIMGTDQKIPRDQFARLIRTWRIPSLQQAIQKEDEEKGYFRFLPAWRRFRAYWAVHGPEDIFIGLVIAVQVACAVWQIIKYNTDPYKAAFGWGVVVAKACAGALYPTFFFLILSKSRYLSTLLRRSYYISRIFNWDLSQTFHIRMACVALLLVVVHALGHLSGTFVHGSKPANWEAVEKILGPGERHYSDYVCSVPGLTGIGGVAIFIIISMLSLPQMRRRYYDWFQRGHLLIYPLIGLMIAHGTASLFQRPLFMYFLAFPTLVVGSERLSRLIAGFNRIDATIEVLDSETVEITVYIPQARPWDYTAGQHILLQVPQVSFFQWHPFTISFCRDKKMMLHIKTDGDWTSKLRALGGETGIANIKVGINGPFGAPAQRFHDFKHSVIIGAGIGITPFSAILADLQHNHDLDHGGPGLPGTERELDSLSASTPSLSGTQSGSDMESLRLGATAPSFGSNYRRTDFHWIVRDGNYLLWLADLLNKVSTSQQWHEENDERRHLDININTHVTAKRNNIATHIYGWLLEMHRTEKHPESPLTGLLNPTHFGRPDFDKILDEHYEEMCRFHASQRLKRKKMGGRLSPRANSGGDYKVGIFYCGAAAVGEILADKCSELTIRGRNDGTKIEYHFMIEVFG